MAENILLFWLNMQYSHANKRSDFFPKQIRKDPNAFPQRKTSFLILHTSFYIILKEAGHPKEGSACIRALKIYLSIFI